MKMEYYLVFIIGFMLLFGCIDGTPSERNLPEKSLLGENVPPELDDCVGLAKSDVEEYQKGIGAIYRIEEHIIR